MPRVTLLHIVELLFLVDVNQHAAKDSIGQTRTIDFEWLKNDVAIRENDRWPPLLHARNGLERVGIKALRKRIADQEIRYT